MMNVMDHRMHEIKTHLETLTTNELIKMADVQGIFIPANLERAFIIQELLEADTELNLEEQDAASANFIDHNQTFELAPLPKQYNVNYLEVLLRDPVWAFVYWEINSLDRKAYESSPDFKGYVLYVAPLPSEGKQPIAEPFTVSVGNHDNSWRIYLQPETASFQVKLCVNRGETKETIISSREIRVPHVLDPSDERVRNIPKYPVLSLSGIEEFEILRNVDRVTRVHRFYEN
jgi:hypothetical protein